MLVSPELSNWLQQIDISALLDESTANLAAYAAHPQSAYELLNLGPFALDELFKHWATNAYLPHKISPALRAFATRNMQIANVLRKLAPNRPFLGLLRPDFYLDYAKIRFCQNGQWRRAKVVGNAQNAFTLMVGSKRIFVSKQACSFITDYELYWLYIIQQSEPGTKFLRNWTMSGTGVEYSPEELYLATMAFGHRHPFRILRAKWELRKLRRNPQLEDVSLPSWASGDDQALPPH